MDNEKATELKKSNSKEMITIINVVTGTVKLLIFDRSLISYDSPRIRIIRPTRIINITIDRFSVVANDNVSK